MAFGMCGPSDLQIPIGGKTSQAGQAKGNKQGLPEKAPLFVMHGRPLFPWLTRLSILVLFQE